MKHPVLHMWSALAFIIITAMALVIIEKFRDLTLSEVAAAWVQAVGSVVAILVAVGLQFAQHRANLSRDRQALADLELQHVNAAYIAARAAVVMLEIAAEQVREPEKRQHLLFFGVDEDEFQIAVARIDDLKAAHFRDAQCPARLAILRRLLTAGRDRLRLIVLAGRDGREPSADVIADFETRLSRARVVETAIITAGPIDGVAWGD